MSAGTAKTPKAVEGEARQPGRFSDAPSITAHKAAIDHFCMNLRSGTHPLTGVDQTYRDTLAIERRLR